MAKRDYKVEALQSFSGGLNLRADQFNLAPTESPDLLNVVVDPRGGVSMRSGVERRNPTALADDVKGIWGFYNDDGTTQVMVNHGTSVAYSGAGDFTDITGITARTDGSTVRGTTFNNVAYCVSFDQPSFQWNGSSAQDLGTTFGAAGNLPQAKYIESWNNFVWVANLYESAVNEKSRVRWSNTNEGNLWSADDYVDVDKGEHGDYITGLVAAGDRMLVFKSNSVSAIYGFDSDTFQVVTLTNTVGSVPESSPVATPYGVFFWNAHDGVYLYDGESFIWLFDKLQPAIDDGRIGFNTSPQLVWNKNRLHVSVDWVNNGTTVRRVLTYDPSLGAKGAWVTSDIDAAEMFTFRPPNGEPIAIGACVANTGSVIHIDDDEDRVVDNYLGSTDVHIDSYFRTPWVSGKNPIVKKRWGKPRMVTLANSSLSLAVDVYKDYDSATAAKSFVVEVAGRASTSLWGTATWSWDGSDTSAGTTDGTGVWASEAESTIADVKRLPTLGTAEAVSMKVTGPTTTNNTWEINALAFTYLNRRMR